MSQFIQFHFLVSYPPSNLNRDDLGRPKTAIVGGTQRLRISSQSLKRAWRQSDVFKESLQGFIGIRTKEMGVQINQCLISGKKLVDYLENPDTSTSVRTPVPDAKAKKWTESIAGGFGKLKSKSFEVEQMVHFSPAEISAIDDLMGVLAERGTDPSEAELKLLRNDHVTADIAMFGRMLASSPEFSSEGAVQVSHSITVHDTPVEDDFFTAVDDLNRGIEDIGAGHIGEAEYGSGLFYTYICINRDLLLENLKGNTDLTKKAISSLLKSALTVSPSGKQNSFASRAYASYLLAEKSNEQPRSLSVAFLKPIKGKDILTDSIAALEGMRDRIDTVYGTTFAQNSRVMNVPAGTGSLQEISEFVSE